MKYFFIAIIGVLLSSCDERDDSVPDAMNTPMVSDEFFDEMTEIIGKGVFTSFEHGFAGKASLSVDSLDRKFLSLDEFVMSQGPDVRVYLSKSNNYSKANVLEVATLTATYNNERLNFEITPDSYSEAHKFVLVYCLKYNSLFGYAELK